MEIILDRTIRALVWVLCSLSVALCGMLAYFGTNRLEYKESFAYIPHQEVIENHLMSNNEIIDSIDKLNNHKFNIEYVKDVDYDGQVRFCALFDNTIYLNQNIVDNTAIFTWTYAHETIHATRICLDELKTQYLTFILLYESGNEYFKQIALYQASNMVYNEFKEYDATYYIADYLKQYK